MFNWFANRSLLSKNYDVCVSVCILSVPPNSNIVQQNGTQSTFGMPLVVECLPGYRLSGSESNGNVNTSIQCNENGIINQTPSCEPKGKVTRHCARAHTH